MVKCEAAQTLSEWLPTSAWICRPRSSIIWRPRLIDTDVVNGLVPPHKRPYRPDLLVLSPRIGSLAVQDAIGRQLATQTPIATR